MGNLWISIITTVNQAMDFDHIIGYKRMSTKFKESSIRSELGPESEKMIILEFYKLKLVLILFSMIYLNRLCIVSKGCCSSHKNNKLIMYILKLTLAICRYLLP